MRWPWQPKAAPLARADRVRIAELEYELFGIEPEPNTVAAFAIGLRRLRITAEPKESHKG